MSGVKLASPTFSAGPQDDLAVADVYDGKEISVLNSIQKLSKSKENEIIKMAEMSGGASAASRLSSWLKTSINFSLPDAGGMLSRLKASASPYLSLVKNAQDSMKGMIAGAMPLVNQAMGAVNQVKSTFNQAQGLVNGAVGTVKSLADTVSGGINGAKGLIDGAKSQVNGITNMVGTVKSTITGSINSIKGSFDNVGRSVDKLTGRNGAARNMSLYGNGAARDQVYVKVGSAMSKISASQLQDFNDIAMILNGLKNEKLIEIEDKESTAAVLAGVVKAASGNHLYGTFALVVKGIEDPVIIRNVAALSLPTMLKAGDITSVRQIAETLDSTVVSMINKDALATLAANYHEKKRLTTNERLVRYRDIISLFDLIDPKWSIVSRQTDGGEQSAMNLMVMKSASVHFVEALRLGSLNNDTTREKMFSLIMLFPVTDVETAIKKSFPMTVIGRDARLNRSVEDPRTIAA